MLSKEKRKPEISNLNIELNHPLSDIFTRRRFSVQHERAGIRAGRQVTMDDEVRFAWGPFEFNLNVSFLFSNLDEALDFVCSS